MESDKTNINENSDNAGDDPQRTEPLPGVIGEDGSPHMKWSELEGELKRYLNEVNGNIPEVRSHKFYQSLMSPVRDQGETGTCAFVASIACLEMIGRLTNVLDREDYFDLHDVFDHVFVLNGDHMRWGDINGNVYGADVSDILKFAENYGLLMDSECRNPRTRNMHASFHREATRTRLASFKFLRGSKSDEVIEAVKESPIIASLLAYESLGACNEDGSKFLIIQNSYGEDAHYKGFVVVPLDGKNFTRFWLPRGLKINKGGLKKKVGMAALVVSSMVLGGLMVRVFWKRST